MSSRVEISLYQLQKALYIYKVGYKKVLYHSRRGKSMRKRKQKRILFTTTKVKIDGTKKRP